MPEVGSYNGLIEIGGGAASELSLTAAGKAILQAANAAAQRSLLGLGNAHFVPTADSTYNLGSDAVRWASIYADNLRATSISIPDVGGGTNDEAFGSGARARYGRSLAIGPSSAAYYYSVAVGLSAVAGTGSGAGLAVAVGVSAVAAVNSVAIGYSTSTQSAGQVAIGHDIDLAAGTGTVAIGNTPTVSSGSLAIGNNPTAGSTYSVALGSSTSAGTSSVAIGGYCGGTQDYGVAVGVFAGRYLTDRWNVSIGYSAGEGSSGASASAEGNVCIGYQAGIAVTGSNGVYLGYRAGNTATAGGNVCVGFDSDVAAAGDTYATAVGPAAVAGSDAVALGRSANAADDTLDIRWANASRITGDASGNVAILADLQAGGYKSSDGSTGVTGSFVDNGGNTVTVKNGLITALS